MAGDAEMRALLRRLFEAAVDAARADRVVPPCLPEPPRGRTLVLGAGKAGAAMARAVEAHWSEGASLSGLVVVPYGHALPTDRVEVVEAAHPVPDEAGQQAARRMLVLARELGPDDLLLCLLSGGGSALMAVPAEGLSLEDKRAVTRALLACGATIREINTVRKHLSAIKGGRLAAAAYPARTVALAISDVAGDDPSVIASGPAAPDPSTFAEARAVLDRYGVEAPPAVRAFLDAAREETPKPGDPRLDKARIVIVARPGQSLAAAARAAEAAGFRILNLGDTVEGLADRVGLEHAGPALDLSRRRERAVLLSGGELTVEVRGKGRGGPNHEYALALALGLDGAPGIWALACDTDGKDGSADSAGALVAPDTLARARAHNLDARRALAENDSHRFFSVLGDCVETGLTRTNVNDFRAILVDPKTA